MANSRMVMRFIRSAPFRIAFGVGAPVLLLAALGFLYRFGNPLPCAFHLVTGLYCPGCGSGRALTALVHLDIGAALGRNPLFVMALPLIAYYLVKQYIVLVFRRDPLPLFRTSYRAVAVVLAVLLAFWVLRNIPVIPFTLLAP